MHDPDLFFFSSWISLRDMGSREEQGEVQRFRPWERGIFVKFFFFLTKKIKKSSTINTNLHSLLCSYSP